MIRGSPTRTEVAVAAWDASGPVGDKMTDCSLSSQAHALSRHPHATYAPRRVLARADARNHLDPGRPDLAGIRARRFRRRAHGHSFHARRAAGFDRSLASNRRAGGPARGPGAGAVSRAGGF